MSAAFPTLNDKLIDGNSHEQKNESTIKANQAYASTAPRIMIEILTARTTALLFIFTYLAFGLGFGLDIYWTVIGFNSSNRQLQSNECSYDSNGITTDYSNVTGDTGCTYKPSNTSSQWAGIVTNLDNIISIELKVEIKNFTDLYQNNTLVAPNEVNINDITLKYSTLVYCCYQGEGCGREFSDDVVINPHAWYSMYDSDSQSSLGLENTYDKYTSSASAILLGYTFQNQEALPMRGKVRSYLLYVNFTQELTDDNEEYAIQLTNETSVEYVVNVVTRPYNPLSYVAGILLLLATAGLLVWYVRVLNDKYSSVSKWLPEQKWIVVYLGMIVLYQNPVFCVIVWMSQAPTGWIFCSYFIDAMAQSALFSIWLLFSDGLRRKIITSRLQFYSPKIAFGLFLFMLQIVVLAFQFCSLNPGHSDRTPVESVENWLYNTKLTFCIFSVLFLISLIIWTLWWFYSLYNTGKTLETLPYMSTRYLQLSYQFFVTQATLVTIYYVFQYMVVIYFVLRDDASTPVSEYGKPNGALQSVTDNVNILFRQQTQLFGKILFLTCYAFILAFLFLPAEVVTASASDTILGSLAATFVITEDEMRVVVKSRKDRMRAVAESASALLYDFNNLVDTKAQVFCIDISLIMLGVSYEVYYDPPGQATESGYGPMDLEKHGFVYIDSYYHAESDMFCLITRHTATNKLVVAFRGTSSKVHWKSNLNFKQRELDLAWMPLSDLDDMDGLQSYVDEYCQLGNIANIEQDNDEEEAAEEKEKAKGIARSGSKDSAHSSRSGSFSELFSFNSDSDGNRQTHRDADTNRLSMMESAKQGAFTVKSGLVKVATTVGGVTTGIAKNTPGLKGAVTPYVHSGFWEGYEVLREFLHKSIRMHLLESPVDTVYFTGHSMGGALATFAALDIKMHTMPRINAYLRILKLREKVNQSSMLKGNQLNTESCTGETPVKLQLVRVVKVALYNFGSPKVGNSVFAAQFNTFIPDSFRVVVDGDIVAGVPKGSYRHIGTEVMIDGLGAGSIIIDPSYIEKRLRTRTKANVSVHSLVVYRQGISGVREAANFMRAHAEKMQDVAEQYDSVKLAMHAGPLLANASWNKKEAKSETADGVLEEADEGAQERVFSDEDMDARHLLHDQQLHRELFKSVREYKLESEKQSVKHVFLESLEAIGLRRRQDEEIDSGDYEAEGSECDVDVRNPISNADSELPKRSSFNVTCAQTTTTATDTATTCSS